MEKQRSNLWILGIVAIVAIVAIFGIITINQPNTTYEDSEYEPEIIEPIEQTNPSSEKSISPLEQETTSITVGNAASMGIGPKIIELECSYTKCNLEISNLYSFEGDFGYELWWRFHYVDNTYVDYCGDWNAGCNLGINNGEKGGIPVWKRFDNSDYIGFVEYLWRASNQGSRFIKWAINENQNDLKNRKYPLSVNLLNPPQPKPFEKVEIWVRGWDVIGTNNGKEKWDSTAWSSALTLNLG